MAAVLQGQTRPRGLSAVRGRRRAGQVEESQLSSRVIAEVREQVRRRGLDPFDAPTEVASIVDAVLNEHDQISARTGSASFEDLEEVRHRILDAVAGFGVRVSCLPNALDIEILLRFAVQLHLHFRPFTT